MFSCSSSGLISGRKLISCTLSSPQKPLMSSYSRSVEGYGGIVFAQNGRQTTGLVFLIQRVI